MKTSRLQSLDFVLHYDFYMCLGRLSITVRHRTPQFEFSGIWKLLRNADADVRKIAIRVARKWAGTAHTELLKRELRVWQRRHLGSTKCRGFRCALGNANCRIILLGFLDEHA